MRPESFRCDVFEDVNGGARRVRPVGELDIATASEFARALNGTPGRLVLDLRALTFMDCAGLDVILRAGSRQLDVFKGPPAVMRVFELTGTEQMVNFVTPLSAAPARRPPSPSPPESQTR